MSIIEVKNLSRSFDYFKKQEGLKASFKGLFKREKLYKEAVKNISFSIEQGEFVGFLGPNGAGKTTTLKMLSGILHPTSGTVKILGYEPHKRQSDYQRQFALVMGQKNQLWWDLPAIESFILNKEIYQLTDNDYRDTLAELSAVLQISDILDIPVRKLSLGQRMKCELALALLHRPKILLLDEPTIGLDVVAQKNIREFLKKYNQKNKTTIILTSHYMEDIKELCSRVIIIDQGVIGFDGQLDDLIASSAPHKVIRLTFDEANVSSELLEKYGKVLRRSEFDADIQVDRESVRAVATKMLSSKLPITDIAIDETDIDEVIRKIFSK
ncbi:MAG: ATP-binding cassette domain-containing protein [bacterium]